MRKKIQFIWMISAVFFSRHIRFIFIGMGLGFFIALLFIQSYPVYNRWAQNKAQKIAIVGRFHERNLPIFIQNQISFGLTSILPSGDATPSLAIRWEIDPSEKIYTFYLNPNMYWHDGKKFISKDLNLKLSDAKFEILNNNSFKITLNEPFSPLPTNLALPISKPNFNGLGIYKLGNVSYQADYISELTLKPAAPELPSITYKFYSSQDDAILAYKLGEINTIKNISDPQDLINWKNTKVTEITNYDNFIGLFFNLKDSYFKEKEVRQALTYSVPNFDKYIKTYTPISPLSWAYSAKVRLYRYDPETAKKILAKSKVSSSSSEITITTFSSFIKLAQSIADAWNKIGVNTKVRIVNSIPGEYQVLLLSQTIPPDPDQYPYWQSTQSLSNLTHYSNLKIDKLLEDGRKTIDREKRMKIYADFQRYLVDDAPVIFLYYPKVYTVERK